MRFVGWSLHSSVILVTARDAVHVVDPPGANDDTGHEIADRPGSGSVTPTEVRVTLPVLVTKKL